jgi:integrase
VKNNVSIDHEKPIKDSTDLKSTKSFDLGGGQKEKWKKILKDVGQTIESSTSPVDGEDMVNLAYDLKRINRLNFPIHLNPQTASFTEVGLHALLRQRLGESTVEKHLRYARFMETHNVPVDFRNPNIQNFIGHMDYREQVEHASANALIHEWKAMQTFLKAYGIPFGQGKEWDYCPPSAQRPRTRILLLPDVVNRFFNYGFSEDPYETALYQYMFFHSYMIGWRVPSEIITMKTTDVRIDDPIPHIIITEPKKRRNTRPLFDVETAILTSKVHKSFKNWADHWRPRVENQYSGDSFYLWPSGKPVTIRTLGHMLSIQGKKIHEEFRPYDMRHWCAVARLIKTKVETGTFDVFQIQKWLGHEEITTTNTYIGQATSYYNVLPVDWISLALKPCRKKVKMAGKRDKEKINRTRFLGLLPEFSPREYHGPVAI